MVKDPKRNDISRTDQPQPWPSCGYALLTVTDDGQLKVTKRFLEFLFQRPELAPLESSCDRERALHASLIANPLRQVQDFEIAALGDPDARENYRIALAFRDLLAQQPSLESAYLALASGQVEHTLPPVLLNLLVQILLRHILDEVKDPHLWRAAELFFRPQKVSLEGAMLLADAEVLERRREPGSITVLQLLIRQAEGKAGDFQRHMDVLTPANAQRYWTHSESFDFALSLSIHQPGAAALCRVLEAWLRHFHGLEALITPLERIDDDHWIWHIGLDVDSNTILNKLYRGEPVEDSEIARLLLLFRLDCRDDERLMANVKGHPLYLALAMDSNHLLRVKPQNILLNMPLTPDT